MLNGLASLNRHSSIFFSALLFFLNLLHYSKEKIETEILVFIKTIKIVTIDQEFVIIVLLLVQHRSLLNSFSLLSWRKVCNSFLNIISQICENECCRFSWNYYGQLQLNFMSYYFGFIDFDKYWCQILIFKTDLKNHFFQFIFRLTSMFTQNLKVILMWYYIETSSKKLL